MKETIFNALLRRMKYLKVHEDSVFFEYRFDDLYISIYWSITDGFDIQHSEEIKLTKKQTETLETLALSIERPSYKQVYEYFENGVKPENFY